jgi:pimeloyl-ACP methyl ester carboxylesterase
MWYPHKYTASAWSRDGVEAYARDLDASIRSKVIEAGKDTSRPISRITLMGHSLGGVLARIAYLISAGQYKENSQGSEWWKKVDRIVLFAAPNRGIESKRFAWRERLAFYSPLGRLGQMARDQLRGSEAITNLRIRWIRFFAELDSSARPAVVQLLGKGDRLVSRDDSLDVEQFSQAWQYDVPGATLSGEAQYPNARNETAQGKLLSRLSGSAVVGLAVAGALLAAFGIAIWLLATLLGSLLPWPPALVWVLAALVVAVTSYLFSRYY